MTYLKRRECDPKNFGARIIEFGVMVEKIWLKEVSRGEMFLDYLWISRGLVELEINMQNWRAQGLSIIIFQISRASLEIFGPWVGFWKSVGPIWKG
jgi:hypothetical protein